MGKNWILVLILVFSFNASSDSSGSLVGKIECFDNDALNSINQDQATMVDGLGLPLMIASNECDNSQDWFIDSKGSVWQQKNIIYDGAIDPVVELKYQAPGSAAAWLTKAGRVWKYSASTGLELWYSGLADPARALKFSNKATLVAVTQNQDLVRCGELESSKNAKVESVKVSPTGLIFVLRNNGSVVEAGLCLKKIKNNSNNTVYSGLGDAATAIKVSQNGTVVFVTHDGRLGQLTYNPKIYPKENQSAAILYGDSSDAVIKFKINSTGEVAYLTRDAKLYRQKTKLSGLGIRVLDFSISNSGSVTAVADDGKKYFY